MTYSWYSNWHESAEALTCHKFCHVPSFLNFITYYEVINPCGFGSYARMAEIRQNPQYFKEKCNDLREKAPFSYTKRFPEGDYLDVDNKHVRPLFDKLFGAVYLDLSEGAESQSTQAEVRRDAKGMFDAAFSSLKDIAKETDPDKLVEYGIYKRITFVKHFELTWKNSSDMTEEELVMLINNIY